MKLNDILFKAIVTQHAPPKIPQKIHQILYAATAIFFSLFGSAFYFIHNDPSSFSRFGSAILAFTVIRITVVRSKFGDTEIIWDRYRAFTHINEIKKLTDLHYKSLDLTFDIHTYRIMKLHSLIDGSESSTDNSMQPDQRLFESINARLDKAKVVECSRTILSETRQAEESYHDAMKRIISWKNLLFPLETALLVWGTLQWGYGDLVVNWWHK